MNRERPIRAGAGWDEIVLVCSDCMRRSDDERLSSLRKWLKRQLKALGYKKRIRVVECGCLDLCPKRGVVLVRGSELAGAGKKLRVHRQGDDPQQLVDWLIAATDERPARREKS